MPVRRQRKIYPSSHKTKGLLAKLRVGTMASTSKILFRVPAAAGVKLADVESVEHTIINQPVGEADPSIFSLKKSAGHSICFSVELLHRLAKFPALPIFLDFFPRSL